jgi:hypothetical protein
MASFSDVARLAQEAQDSAVVWLAVAMIFSI